MFIQLKGEESWFLRASYLPRLLPDPDPMMSGRPDNVCPYSDLNHALRSIKSLTAAKLASRYLTVHSCVKIAEPWKSFFGQIYPAN